jgi:hypothetical protein
MLRHVEFLFSQAPVKTGAFFVFRESIDILILLPSLLDWSIAWTNGNAERSPNQI